jgi:hypothetical protein
VDLTRIARAPSEVAGVTAAAQGQAAVGVTSASVTAAGAAAANSLGDEGRGEALPRMRRTQFWATLALALALFCFWTGPIWRHPWDIEQVDQAILWSYIPIPLLVGAFLLWSRRFTLRAFFLDTLGVTLLKYACTFAFALVLWDVSPTPAAAAPAARAVLPAPSDAPADVEPQGTPTPINADETGVIEGTVEGEGGLAASGALVFVSAGLEAYTFAPPSEPVSLVNTGASVTPSVAAVQAGQTLLARSDDGRLHTLVAAKEGAALFNMPLLSSGEPRRAQIQEPHGHITVRCNVHDSSREKEGHLYVLSHPFFTMTDGQGRFRLSGVPAGSLRLLAVREGQRSREEALELAPRGASVVRLKIER